MRYLMLMAALLMCVTPAQSQVTAAAYAPLSHCGTERWHIKTLDDAGVNHISNTPKTATISAMNALAVPAGFNANNDTSRYTPVEFEKFTIDALVTGFKEESDRDFHIVIADPNHTSVTMIAEIPDPQCSTMKVSGHAQEIASVRNAFTACFGAPPAGGQFKKLAKSVRVQIMGIGFFDRLHGQTGVAKNGIELHPAMSITASGACPVSGQGSK